MPYDVLFKNYIKNAVARAKKYPKRTSHDATIQGLERELTERHARTVAALLNGTGLKARDVDVIGFHGHTLDHRPNRDPGKAMTWQIGDGRLLAKLTGIDVVCDFRSNDTAHGGQGAPLLPLYHAALMRGFTGAEAAAVLNIGGVANVTWMRFAGDDPALLAFDTGPGNALIDDWMLRHAGRPFDDAGALAAGGACDDRLLANLLDDPYFAEPPPKSLDRDHFSLAVLEGLSPADGAATLTAFTAAAIEKAQDWMPGPPATWYASGGGRHNATLMAALAERLDGRVTDIEEAGLKGDAIEAEGFAFLAVRALKDLPLSLPGTTGVDKPRSGGTLYRR